MRRFLLCCFVFFDFAFSMLENLHKRHEYQLTFKGPTITPPNSYEIPFFDVGGHVIAGKDRVRLTTSLPNQQGWIWSKTSASFDGFQIDLEFKISGNGRIGADGLALWLTQSKSYDGLALGANPVFNGLGILFDTFDPLGHRRSPIVLGIVNDGTKAYSPENDGRDISIGQCIREFRNMPFAIQCRVTYFNKLIVVTMSSGLSRQDPTEMEECFRANIDLPKAEYYFGLTSSTGSLADDHDVEKLEVHSLTEKGNIKVEDEKKRDEERKRYEEEYQHKMDNIAKTENKENQPKEDLGDKGISQNLIAIWHEIAGQHNTLKNLKKSISLIQTGMSGTENNNLKSQLDSITKEMVALTIGIEGVSHKVDNNGNTYQGQQAFTQIHNSFDGLKSDIMKIFEKISSLQETVNHIRDNDSTKTVTDTCGSCVSLPLMIILGSLQSAFVIGFLIYQKNRDNAAKKFY